MSEFTFERETRTPHSESYSIDAEGGELLGRVDIHYTTGGIVQATLCVTDELSEEALQDLIAEVDERLVMTADPFREDFIVSVWRGRAAGVYSEESDGDLEETESDDHNGHH